MTVVWLKFNSSYEVSNMGEVRSVDRCVIRRDTLAPVIFKGKTLKLGRHRDGYLKLSLSEQNRKKMYFVHRLVALTFIPNPDNLPQVNHIDGNKSNNVVSNLEWVDNSKNQIHAITTGLKVIKVAKEAYRYEGEVTAWDKDGKIVAIMSGNMDMAAKGFDFRLVSACLLGKRNTHRGCTFSKNFVKEI